MLVLCWRSSDHSCVCVGSLQYLQLVISFVFAHLFEMWNLFCYSLYPVALRYPVLVLPFGCLSIIYFSHQWLSCDTYAYLNEWIMKGRRISSALIHRWISNELPLSVWCASQCSVTMCILSTSRITATLYLPYKRCFVHSQVARMHVCMVECWMKLHVCWWSGVAMIVVAVCARWDRLALVSVHSTGASVPHDGYLIQ